MNRVRQILIASWHSLLVLTLMGWFCIWKGAAWPTQWHIPVRQPTDTQLQFLKNGYVPPELQVSQQNFLIFVGIMLFLMIKSDMLYRRMGVVDWLTISLIAVNLAFAMLYQLVISGSLFPLWFATHIAVVEWMQTGLRILVTVTLAWGSWQLITVAPLKHKRYELPVAIVITIAFVSTAAVIALGRG